MATLKAIVFKTQQLKATRQFFEEEIGLAITESSQRHFAILGKRIRIVFLQSEAFNVEWSSNANRREMKKRSWPNKIPTDCT